EMKPDVPKLQKEAEKDEQADCHRAQTAGGASGRGGDARRDCSRAQADGASEGHKKHHTSASPLVRHWCFKRKYLQGKRGIEKPPFKLPEFIKRTGIQEMREALQEKMSHKVPP
ncbi:splicing factor 3B subunit 2, partial [Silurus asotus]